MSSCGVVLPVDSTAAQMCMTWVVMDVVDEGACYRVQNP